MLKLLGAICIIGSCCAFAAQRVMIKQRSLHAVRDLRDLCRELARDITFRLTPLPELIHSLSQIPETPAMRFLQHLDDSLLKDASPTLQQCWPTALKAFQCETQLPEKAFKIASALGESLGQTDFETESERLLLAATELDELQLALHDDAEKTEKITKSLCLLVGIGIVILLL